MLKSLCSNAAIVLVEVAVVFILTPYVIGALGTEAYGVWLVIVSLTSYLLLVQGGLPAASVRFMAERFGVGESTDLNKAIATSLLLYIMASSLALVGGAGLLFVFEMVYDVPAQLQAAATAAYVVALLTIWPTILKNFPFNIVEAHEDYPSRNLIFLGSLLIRLVLTIGVLAWQASIVLLALVLLLCQVFELVLAVRLVKRRYPEVRLGLRGASRDMAQRIFQFGAVTMILLLGTQVAFRTDALVIGGFLPMSSVAVYSVANRLALYLTKFVSVLAEPLMPRATKLWKDGRSEELRSLFLVGSKVAFSVALLGGLYLIILGPEFLGWWINPDFESLGGIILQVLVASFVIVLPASTVGLRFLMGVGRPTLPALIFLGAGFLNLGLSLTLVKPLGLLGVALGTAVPNVLLASVILPIACRQVGGSLREYLAFVIWRPMLGAVPVAAVLLGFKFILRPSDFSDFFWAGITMLMVFGAIWHFWVFRGDPYLDLQNRTRSLAKSAWAYLKGS